MSSNGNTPAAQPSILIANDQEWTLRSLESILATEGYQVIRAYTGAQALDRVLAGHPDLIILDTQLPDISGPEVCRKLRETPSVGWHVPIILTTAGAKGRSRVHEALEAGAWDFATQPFDGPALLARIRTYLRAKQAHDLAWAEATVDATTGAYTARGLVRRLAEMQADTRRRTEPLTCVAVAVSDPEIQAATDRLEATAALVASVLRDAVRGTDAIARISSLEFAVVAANLGPDNALLIVDRFHRHLAARNARLDVRTGLATLEARHDGEAGELIRRALAATRSPASGPAEVSG